MKPGESNPSLPIPGAPTEIRNCWAYVEKPGMKDYQMALQNATENEFSFTIRRSNTEITNDMYVIFQGKELQIKNVIDDFVNKKYTTLITKGVE